ncbi:MAG: response regulator [Leptospiraceae bacterium]|nr:response regulator [Leptospiraceae bacterium]
MKFTSSNNLYSSFQRTAKIVGYFSITTGSLVLIGWAFDISIFKSVFPHFASMKSMTAFLFILCGLWILLPNNLKKIFPISIASIVSLIGLLVLIQYLFSLDFGIDRIFFYDSSEKIFPGRMAPSSAFIFFIIGFAMIIVDTLKKQWIIDTFVLISFLISALAVYRYIFGVSSLYQISIFTSVAIHTSITFLLICVGILLKYPDKGIMQIISSNHSGGTILRRVLPYILLIPPLLAWLRIKGQEFGYFDTTFGIIILTIGNTIIFTFIILRNGSRLNSLDKKQKENLEELSHFHRIQDQLLQEEKSLKLSEFQNIILNGTEYSIIAIDVNGIIINFNKGAEIMLGYKAEELIGITSPAILHDLDEVILKAEILSKELNTIVEPGFEVFVAKSKLGKADINEWTYIRKDKSKLTVELSVTTLRDKNGEITGFLGIAKDITESKKLKEEIIRAKEQAEAATFAKSEFLANMTHELRTPLNGVIGFTDLLIKTKLDEEQKRFMATVYRSANSLLDLINDILDFSKIEAGKLELNFSEVDLSNLLAQVIDIVRYKAQKKQLDIILHIEENTPNVIKTDPIRLRQILINLLGNAIKFTEHGKIEINIKVLEAEEEEKKTKILFSVKDTGIGISEENQKNIFNAFAQADSSTHRKYGGTGLGLSISNKLLGLMNTRLELKSELGKGSNFYFELWATTGVAIEDKIKEQEELRITKINRNFDGQIFKILIADDNPVNLFLMKSILIQILPNAIIIETNNGQRALELYKTEKPNIIFMDIQMPEMNGYETSKAIREIETESPILIIAVTAGTVTGERERCELAGMNDYLTKPVIKSSIENSILKWLSGNDSFLIKTENEPAPVVYMHYNEKMLLERLQGDEEFLHSLHAKVKEDFNSDFLKLSESYEEKNFTKFNAAAHKIKGTALTLCFENLANLTSILESLEAFEEENIREQISQVQEEIELLKTMIS